MGCIHLPETGPSRHVRGMDRVLDAIVQLCSPKRLKRCENTRLAYLCVSSETRTACLRLRL